MQKPNIDKNSEGTIETINYESLKIGFYNINGLKLNEQKLLTLANWGKDKELDIVGIAEMNINREEGKWIKTTQQGYISFWSPREEDKHKGSGVGVLVNKQWSKHIGKVDRYSPYALKIELFFKKTVIQVWVIYLPPADKKANRET